MLLQNQNSTLRSEEYSYLSLCSFSSFSVKTVEEFSLLICIVFWQIMSLQIQQNYYQSILGQEQCVKMYTESDVVNNWDNKLIIKCFCEQTYTGTIDEQL